MATTALVTSMIGESPTTVTVSATEATSSTMLRLDVKPGVSVMPSRMMVREPLKLESDAVDARGQQRETVVALLVADDRPPSQQGRAAEGHVHTGQGRARPIGDASGDDAILSPTGRCGDQQQTHREPDSEDSTHDAPRKRHTSCRRPYARPDNKRRELPRVIYA